MTLTDTKILLRRLIQYRTSLQNHLDQLTANFIQLENRWRSFKASSQGDYASDFQPKWERTAENFKMYMNQSQKVNAFLDERIDALNNVNKPDMKNENYPLDFNHISSTAIAASLPISSPSEDTTNLWDKEYCGLFNQNNIIKVLPNLKGIYCIHNADFSQQYIGKSDDCIKGRLKKHFKESHNKNLNNLIASGEDIFFYCWESPDPKYEEALEIKRLKEMGFLKGQRNERKPLIEYLD